MSRNEKIIQAVVGGLSYSEAGERFGITREAVAGVCWRAGVKIGGTRAQHKAKIVAASKARANPDLCKARHRAACRERGRALSRGLSLDQANMIAREAYHSITSP